MSEDVMMNYTAVQCCDCLKVLVLDFKERESIENVWCLSCALKKNKEITQKEQKEAKN